MSHIISLSSDRVSLAESALYEISCLSEVVKSLNTEGEEIAQVLPAMMARIRALSESVSTLINGSIIEDDEAPALLTLINSKKPTKEDVTGLLTGPNEVGAIAS